MLHRMWNRTFRRQVSLEVIIKSVVYLARPFTTSQITYLDGSLKSCQNNTHSVADRSKFQVGLVCQPQLVANCFFFKKKIPMLHSFPSSIIAERKREGKYPGEASERAMWSLPSVRCLLGTSMCCSVSNPILPGCSCSCLPVCLSVCRRARDVCPS